ncbi:helix-turn-helix domain-containing protein [Portibacter marinus]|uniref:helix-turn-helix domain-containing protein n=1 Tax=Portibacter marinus TaxID=2898660 RepID=UPI001F4829A9|nr:helix-turn-helix domain-containing protein [Portibacter marinus]
MQNQEAELAEAYALHTNQNFFLTGKAGTGKTTLLKRILDKSDKNTVVVAPTGVAAINAGGSTIHSMFGFPLKIFVPSFEKVDMNRATNRALLKNHLRYREDKRKVIQELDLLIIDEISMVRADLLDAIDYALKYTRKNQWPFGGVQVIVIGDLFQLSPIAREQDWAILRNHYQSPYFFHSKIWQECNPFLIELKKVYRQEQQDFIDVLNKIRNGHVDKQVMHTLNQRYEPDFTTEKSETIVLTTHNATADDINLKALNALDAKARKYKAEIDGNFSESSFPIDEVLTLKKGAQIMFIRNDMEEGAYYNGKLARIESIGHEDIKVKFLDEDRSYYIKKVKWENKVYSLDQETNEISQEVVGSFTQYPVRLAWAITIHKSQGLTFDRAVIDIGNAFAMGQSYVALSRCTNLEGMVLTSKLNPRSVKVNPQIQQYYQTAPELNVLKTHLQKAKNLYALQKIRRAFTLAYLKDDLDEWQKVMQTKTIPEKNKAVKTLMNISQSHQKMASIAHTFQAQLDHLFKTYKETEDSSPIVQRSRKAIAFFSEEIFHQLIVPAFEHISLYARKKGTKAYIKVCRNMLKSFWASLERLYKLKFEGQKIWEGKELTKEDLPAYDDDMTSAAMIEGNTFEITLEMHRAGASIEEIAAQRSMATSTIEGHIAKWIKTGQIDIYKVMNKIKVGKILKGMEAENERRLSVLKSKLDFDVSYAELRFVNAYEQSKMGEKN